MKNNVIIDLDTKLVPYQIMNTCVDEFSTEMLWDVSKKQRLLKDKNKTDIKVSFSNSKKTQWVAGMQLQSISVQQESCTGTVTFASISGATEISMTTKIRIARALLEVTH